MADTPTDGGPAFRITLDTPLKFTAPGGVAYAGRGRWHLPQGDQPGEWMCDYKSRPILCNRGYHWCRARDALHHMHAECWLIETRGVTVVGDHKSVSQGARLLRRVETWNERTQRLFAADCAEAVVHLCGDDPRPRAAIETARRFARGEASADELIAARDAARVAAWVAAGAAARDAAWVAAGAAAGAAARAAAWTAAWDAVRAARDAAGDAAWAARDASGDAAWAARDAARDAAWATRAAAGDAQTARLLQYLNGETGNG